MNKLPKNDNKSNIEKEINRLLLEANNYEPNSEEYKAIIEQVEILCKAKSYEKTNKISMDTLLTVAGSLLGIVLILGYEQAHAITSKALGFVIKGHV